MRFTAFRYRATTSRATTTFRQISISKMKIETLEKILRPYISDDIPSSFWQFCVKYDKGTEITYLIVIMEDHSGYEGNLYKIVFDPVDMNNDKIISSTLINGSGEGFFPEEMLDSLISVQKYLNLLDNTGY